MNRTLPDLLVLFAGLLLTACSGGGDSSSNNGPTPPDGVTDQQRIQAATATAQNNSLCIAIRPFYWEIGDRSAAKACGLCELQRQHHRVHHENSLMSIASASKWLYGSYVAQRRAAALTADSD